MARIRSIKPEFWTDGKIADLSDNTALFFVAIWSVADDHGFFSCDTRELSLCLPRWRSQSVFKMLCALSERGLIRLCGTFKVGQVVNWNHQRIKDKRASKWTDKEIVWDEVPVNAPGSRKTRLRRGEERSKGEERRGLSSVGAESADPVPATTPHRVRKRGAGEGVGSGTWDLYSRAYEARHGAVPVRNAVVNTQLASVVKKLGAEEAPLVAEFFVSHNDQFYVRNFHPVWLLMRDAEKLRTEWATNRQVTSGQARQVEQKANVIDVWGPLIAEAERKQREGA